MYMTKAKDSQLHIFYVTLSLFSISSLFPWLFNPLLQSQSFLGIYVKV